MGKTERLGDHMIELLFQFQIRMSEGLLEFEDAFFHVMLQWRHFLIATLEVITEC